MILYNIIIRYLSAVTLGLLMLNEQNEEDLIEDGVLEALDKFVADHSPDQVYEYEKKENLKWKIMKPFLDPTLSRYVTVQRIGVFAIAALAYQGINSYIHVTVYFLSFVCSLYISSNVKWY